MELLILLAIIALFMFLVVIPITLSSLHGKSNEALHHINQLTEQLSAINADLKKLRKQVPNLKNIKDAVNQAIEQQQLNIAAMKKVEPIVSEPVKTVVDKVEVVTEQEITQVIEPVNIPTAPLTTTISPAAPIIATEPVELIVTNNPIINKITNELAPTESETVQMPTSSQTDERPDKLAVPMGITEYYRVSNKARVRKTAKQLEEQLSNKSEHIDSANNSVNDSVVQDSPQPISQPVYQPALQSDNNTQPNTPSEPEFNLWLYLWSWFIKGNPLAKVGITLLFLGLSYLLKYSIDNQILPIELRLAGTAFIGFGLLGVGWYLRKKQSLYALILQGGAIGVLYITVFAAFRLYDLLPHPLAFLLMLAICAGSVSLAVLQRAMSLAVVASLGGYLAPILLSTGGGSHIGLFSYYLLISTGILVISLWQSWRILNLIGFCFTFGIALVWGKQYYQPDFYLECQLFLIANLLIYGILAVLLSLRSQKTEQYQTLIDTLLLFGAPLCGFGMQYTITKAWPFGPAFSAVGFGLFYLVGALIIFRYWPRLSKRISFYGLGLGGSFATLAIPLALSAEWTSLAWLVEGLAIVWVGLLQRQYRLAWVGSGLMILGLMAVVRAINNDIANSAFLMVMGLCSLAMLTAAALWYFYRPEKSYHNYFSHGFAAVSVLSSLSGIISGAYRLVSNEFNHPLLASLAMIAGLVWIWRELGRRLQWVVLRQCCWLLWPFLCYVLLPQLVKQTHVLESGWWALAWLLALSSGYLLARLDGKLFPWFEWRVSLPISLFWITLLLLANELVWATQQLPWGMEELQWGILVIAAASTIGFVYQSERRFNWPDVDYRYLFWQIGLLPIAFLLLIALITGLFLDGQMANWPYVPLLNPLEEAAIFAWFMLAIWNKKILQKPLFAANGFKKYSHLVLIVIAVLWANNGILKALSYYGDINWNLRALWYSSSVQAAFAIVWTLSSLVMMIWATRRSNRFIWLVGAAILALVIVKLLAIDSASSGGLARAIAFIGVAILMLIVGYFSPLPPKKQFTSIDPMDNADHASSGSVLSNNSKEPV